MTDDDCSGLPPANLGIMPALGRPLVDCSAPSEEGAEKPPVGPTVTGRIAGQRAGGQPKPMFFRTPPSPDSSCGGLY